MNKGMILISAGQGPEECAWVVERLAKALEKELRGAGLESRILEFSESRSGLARSLLMVVSGKDVVLKLKPLSGTVQWVGQSPFRANHKRKNWFVTIRHLPVPEDVPELRADDLEYSAMKASGPGGQHVNKTNSAVRLRHKPSGISTVAQEERSQHANRRLALQKLVAMLEQGHWQAESAQRTDRWSTHQQLERGNAVRVYEGSAFKRIR